MLRKMSGFFEYLKKHTGKNVIRKKLLLYFLISAVLVNSVSFLTYNNTRVLISKINSIFLHDIALTNLSKNVDTVENSIKGYLMTSHSEDLQNYLNSSDALRNRTDELNSTLSNNEGDLLLLDIKNMISTYLDDTDAAMQYKRGTDINNYNDKFNEASTIYGYIDKYIDKIKIFQFQENNENYLQLDSKLAALQVFNIVVILAAMVGNIILIFLFAFGISGPIIKLSKSANEIAKGNYNIPEVVVVTNDEIKTLALAFNRMTASIRKQLIEAREKARIEGQLKEKELQNLKMKSMLYEAQLGSLQAQIDPHYMFNTLNAGMQLAMFEGAVRTQEFMENLSLTMRYNLGNIKKPATLSQEIENIDNYFYLLKERFGDKIAYVKHIDEELPDVVMPRMILQPIVENSFTHGIGEKERGGVISLSAIRSGNIARVEIVDNGSGMSSETISKILSEDYLNSSIVLGESTETHYSIGMRNVIGRLMLYYHATEVNEVFEIESELGVGTKVSIKLPFSDLEVHDV
jgi:two-component system sensor histidine kinase YesM